MEAQIETAEVGNGAAFRVEQTVPVELQLQKNSLLLSKKRIEHDIEQSRNPRHAQLLKAALDDLDQKLLRLGV
ncbi:MAG: hypothetical protein PHX83_08675 [Acidobacteriia bacterium]|nr:hypothetical protein [Terriglobia bacterium]